MRRALANITLVVAILVMLAATFFYFTGGRYQGFVGGSYRYLFVHLGAARISLQYLSNPAGGISPSGLGQPDVVARDFGVPLKGGRFIGLSFAQGSFVLTRGALVHITIIYIPYYLIAMTAGILAALTFRVVRRKPIRENLCPTCGYDLRASPDRCPECGTAKAK